ncbi:MAG: pyruvate kinase, partial [Campylobacterales bacterium]
MRKTKIVATLGPATSNVETIRALIKAGVNVFRFNFSHGSHDQHEANLTMIRRIAQEEGVYVAILQDISGPKIRVGVIEGVMSLKVGDRLSFYREGSHQDLFGVTLNYPQILNDLSIGELIYLADGTIRVEVVAIEDGVVHTKVLVGGDLVSRKGVNFPSSRLSIPAITSKDIDDIKFGVRIGVDLMAISFVRRGEDMKQAREIVARVGGNVPLFAKIEKSEALENLDEILDASDGIMVARGDLGVELGVHRVPAAQKRVIAKANERGLPVITATQMLTSMIHSPYPTRAEVSDIANAVLDGSDAVMLSDETTIGSYPELAVKVLDETIRDIERIYPYHRYLNETHPPHLAVAASAVQMAQDI